MTTTPVQPTQAPTFEELTRRADGSLYVRWTNHAFTGRTYSTITFEERVGGTWYPINNVGYPTISNQEYILYQKHPIGSGGFEPGKGYEIRLKAFGPAGWSGPSNSRSVEAMETPNPTFTSVTRTSATNAVAELAQNPDPPATVAAVYAYIRKPLTSKWTQVNRTTSSSQTILNLPLPDGSGGQEWESALRSAGPAGWSDYTTPRLIGSWWEEPDAVEDLEAVRDAVTGDTELSWVASSGTPEAPRVTIEILRAAGEEQFKRIASIPGTRGGYVDRSGDDTRSYRYRVVVHSHAGSAAATTGVLPATVMVPGAPSNVEAVYAATDQVRVDWTRTVSAERPVTGQEVGWQDESAVPEDPDDWNWTSVGSTAVTATLPVGANRRVRTTVRASNAAGVSELASPSGLVTTTPAGPVSLSAAWLGDDIILTIAPRASVGDRLRVEFTTDGTVQFPHPQSPLAVTARRATHPAAGKTVPHTYRAWVESDAEGTPDSAVVTSNTLAGLTKPAPPTVSVADVLDATEDIPVPVLHNPLDGSALTEGWMEHRAIGGMWASYYYTEGLPVIEAGTYPQGTQVEVRAQTAGQSGERSDWSTPVSFTLRARPVPVFTGPPAVVAGASATTSWTATGQTSATVELLDSEGLVLDVVEVGAAVRKVPWTTVLEDSGNYSTRLVMRDAYQASLPIVRAFSVDIDSPAEPSLAARFDPVTASVVADIVGSAGERLELWRLDRDGQWRPLGEADAEAGGRTNLVANPSFEAASPIPAGASRTDVWAADGAWSIHVPVDVEHVGGGVWETSAPVAHLGDGVYETHPLIAVSHTGDGVYEMEEA